MNRGDTISSLNSWAELFFLEMKNQNPTEAEEAAYHIEQIAYNLKRQARKMSLEQLEEFTKLMKKGSR